MTKRRLKATSGIFPSVEVRPTLSVSRPNEIVVLLTIDVEDDEGNAYRLVPVLSADEFKVMVRDIMLDILEAQKQHNIPTPKDLGGTPGVPPGPKLWQPGDNGGKGG